MYFDWYDGHATPTLTILMHGGINLVFLGFKVDSLLFLGV